MLQSSDPRGPEISVTAWQSKAKKKKLSHSVDCGSLDGLSYVSTQMRPTPCKLFWFHLIFFFNPLSLLVPVGPVPLTVNHIAGENTEIRTLSSQNIGANDSWHLAGDKNGSELLRSRRGSWEGYRLGR